MRGTVYFEHEGDGDEDGDVVEVRKVIADYPDATTEDQFKARAIAEWSAPSLVIERVTFGPIGEPWRRV